MARFGGLYGYKDVVQKDEKLGYFGFKFSGITTNLFMSFPPERQGDLTARKPAVPHH